MSIRVISHREAGTAPELEHFHVLGMLFEFTGVDKPIDFGSVGVSEFFEDDSGHVGASHAGRQRSVSGQIVDSKGNLLGEVLGDKCQGAEAREAEAQGTRYYHRRSLSLEKHKNPLARGL